MDNICKCGHAYDVHTYSEDKTGCDECDCHINIVTHIINERDKYRAALENIVNGDYDNAHEINAARAYAARILK